MLEIVAFCDGEGRAPFVDWLLRLPGHATIRCRARLALLADQGHRLRRPSADYLRDGIYELRAKVGKVQYRMLYFFHGRVAVVISHGITKQEAMVPDAEIERARARKQIFESNPSRHSFKVTI